MGVGEAGRSFGAACPHGPGAGSHRAEAVRAVVRVAVGVCGAGLADDPHAGFCPVHIGIGAARSRAIHVAHAGLTESLEAVSNDACLPLHGEARLPHTIVWIFAILVNGGAFADEIWIDACDTWFVARRATANAVRAERRHAVGLHEAGLPLRTGRAILATTIDIRLVAILQRIIASLAGILKAITACAAMNVHQALDALATAIAEARRAHLTRRLRCAGARRAGLARACVTRLHCARCATVACCIVPVVAVLARVEDAVPARHRRPTRSTGSRAARIDQGVLVQAEDLPAAHPDESHGYQPSADSHVRRFHRCPMVSGRTLPELQAYVKRNEGREVTGWAGHRFLPSTSSLGGRWKGLVTRGTARGGSWNPRGQFTWRRGRPCSCCSRIRNWRSTARRSPSRTSLPRPCRDLCS